MCCILSPAPFDLINLLLDFERFKIIEFWLVRLEFCIKFIFAPFFLEEETHKYGSVKSRRVQDAPLEL